MFSITDDERTASSSTSTPRPAPSLPAPAAPSPPTPSPWSPDSDDSSDSHSDFMSTFSSCSGSSQASGSGFRQVGRRVSDGEEEGSEAAASGYTRYGGWVLVLTTEVSLKRTQSRCASTRLGPARPLQVEAGDGRRETQIAVVAAEHEPLQHHPIHGSIYPLPIPFPRWIG
uniref:Uncharacterized protein n=1 Tax=Arundo donax TaxID=35708 RepID=A0A0A9GHX9_ARUDO